MQNGLTFERLHIVVSSKNLWEWNKILNLFATHLKKISSLLLFFYVGH